MKRLIAVVVLLLVAMTVQAQDLTETYVFENASIQINYPDNWEVVEGEEFISLETDETSLIPGWYFPENYEENDIEAGDVESVLRASTAHLEDHNFDEDAIDTVEFDGIELTTYEYESEFEGETYEVIKIVRELPEEGYFIATVFPAQDATLDRGDRDDAFAIVASVVDLQAGGSTGSTQDGNLAGVISYDIPEGWEMTVDEDDLMHVANDDTNASLYYILPEDFGNVDLEEGDLEGGLEIVVNFIYGESIDFDTDDIETEGDVLVYPYEVEADGDTVSGRVALIELSDGSMFGADIYPHDADDELNEDDFETVLEMLESGERIDSSSSGGPSTAGGNDDNNTNTSGFEESFTFDDFDFTVFYPEDWNMEESEGKVALQSDDSYIDVIPTDDRNVDDALEAFYERNNLDFDADDLTTSGDITFGEYFFEGDTEYNGVVFARELEDGTVLLIDVYPLEGEDVNQDDVETAQEILEAVE